MSLYLRLMAALGTGGLLYLVLIVPFLRVPLDDAPPRPPPVAPEAQPFNVIPEPRPRPPEAPPRPPADPIRLLSVDDVVTTTVTPPPRAGRARVVKARGRSHRSGRRSWRRYRR